MDAVSVLSTNPGWMPLGGGWERKRMENQNTTPMVIIKHWNIKPSHTLSNSFLNKSNSSEIFIIPVFEPRWHLYLAEEKPLPRDLDSPCQTLWFALCCILIYWRRDSLPSKQLYPLMKVPVQCKLSSAYTQTHTTVNFHFLAP